MRIMDTLRTYVGFNDSGQHCGKILIFAGGSHDTRARAEQFHYARGDEVLPTTQEGI